MLVEVKFNQQVILMNTQAKTERKNLKLEQEARDRENLALNMSQIYTDLFPHGSAVHGIFADPVSASENDSIFGDFGNGGDFGDGGGDGGGDSGGD